MFTGDRVARINRQMDVSRPELLAISKGKDFLIVLLSISRDMGRLVAIETDHQQRIVTVVRTHQASDRSSPDQSAPHTPIMR
ncbi:hypothetical protein BN1232_05672 [Mycobacterium lentiflavum]|uniref:Uncharacterized protein n=1 Tax=Mycobacterium lentiflavum TaxID=141349 RepID=A0A0E4H245_MYCLN|nr:hypothetical protein BN1232_05672 [Mycobacterium lentiflavum]